MDHDGARVSTVYGVVPIDSEVSEFLLFVRAKVFPVHGSSQVSGGSNGSEDEDLCGEDKDELSHVLVIICVLFVGFVSVNGVLFYT